MGAGCIGIKKINQMLMEERAPQNECFFHPFCDIY